MSGSDEHESVVHSFAELAADAAELGRAARELVQSELALSRQSLPRFVAGALVLPILAVGLWLGLNGLLIAALRMLGCNWIGAFALDVGVQLGILAVLLRALRRWLRDMSFPNSRQIVDQVRQQFS